MADAPKPESVYDVVIIGAGFAGAILARALNRRGFHVLLLERGHHPRFALGESTTPLANLALERLAARFDLPDLHHLASYGRWLRHFPHLRRGLKRGFTFFDHTPGRPYRNSGLNEARLMVAAGPDDQVADTHWLRQDVDQHLVREAVREGVDYQDRSPVVGLAVSADSVLVSIQGMAGRADRPERQARGRYVVDAGGAGGVVARKLGIPHRVERAKLDTSLLYGHFEGIEPLASVAPEARLGDGPYPEERAAVHHLLRCGWMYQLPFDHGVTSAGLVLRNNRLGDMAANTRRDPNAAWLHFLSQYPSLAAQFRHAEAITRVRHIPRLPFQYSRGAGARWFLLPQAYAFFDPLFSVGIAWSLQAIERLVDVLDGGLNSWRSYARLMSREAEQIRYLTEAAYRAMDHFEHFTAVSLLYFAAVSYSEVQQRLADPDDLSPAWGGFMGANDPVIQSLLVQARDRLTRPDGGLEDFSDWVRRRIASRDIVGLTSPKTPNLYPVDLNILVERSRLLGMEPAEMAASLPKLRGDLDPQRAPAP